MRSAVRDVLLHVALHGSYHRGQLAWLARTAGAVPTATDFIVFSRGAQMRLRALASTWAIAFAALAAVGAVVYAQLPAHTGPGLWLSPVLGPGVALYDVWNGSLLFGSGFGRIGNFAVFVLGSAVAWASVLVALVLLVRAVASSVRAPRT